MKIQKVILPNDRGGHRIRLQNNSKVLSVGAEGGAIIAWVQYDPHPDTARDEWWNFSSVLIGEDFIPYGRFVGTVILSDNAYHVYAGQL